MPVVNLIVIGNKAVSPVTKNEWDIIAKTRHGYVAQGKSGIKVFVRK